jgi:hypothetical protein
MDSWITMQQAHGRADYRARAIARNRTSRPTRLRATLRHVTWKRGLDSKN